MISAPLSWETASAELAEAPDYVQLDFQTAEHSSLVRQLHLHRRLGSPIVSIDLHPIEKNFFLGISGETHTQSIIQNYYQQLHQSGEKNAVQWLLSKLTDLPDYAQQQKGYHYKAALVEADPKRVRFFQSKHYDYYHELVKQYVQLKSQQPEWSEWIYTIQGLHALGVGYPDDDQLKDGEAGLNVNRALIKSRIRQLKGEEPIEGTDDFWQHCPLALSLASHFHNSYCGQASSLPEILRLLYDQRGGKDLGFLQEGTYDLIYELLGIDSQMQLTGSRRIWIDVRHMSPAARKTYYQHVVARFNENPANRDQRIPIIATNVGFSGVDSLDELIRNASEGKEKDAFRNHGFLAWGYNLSDEDVIAIFNSHGLINITNDRRLLGDEEHWTSKLGLKKITARRGRQLVKRTIEQFVRIPFDYFLTQPLKIWDVISFHPAISPTQAGTGQEALCWETIEADLLHILSELKKEEPLLFGNYRPEDVVQKICYGNIQRVMNSQSASNR